MEIERKFLIEKLPMELSSLPCHMIQQAYLSTDPVVRVRCQDQDYYLTYKARGFLAREEYNLPLTKESYFHLLEKADGIILTKIRYLFPLEGALTLELDVFKPPYQGLVIGEVEFPSEEDAKSFRPPAWFGREVTYDPAYQNSTLSMKSLHIS